MKKNLLSILILALLLVNTIMTGIMMFSTLNASNKTAKLVGDIATVLDLELNGGTTTVEEEETVSISDTDVYVLSEMKPIPLKSNGDGREHVFVVTVSLSMNKKHADYKKFGGAEDLAAKESLIKGIISEVVSGYTLEECKENLELIRQQILLRVQQEIYDSSFIYNVIFSDYLYN